MDFATTVISNVKMLGETTYLLVKPIMSGVYSAFEKKQTGGKKKKKQRTRKHRGKHNRRRTRRQQRQRRHRA